MPTHPHSSPPHSQPAHDSSHSLISINEAPPPSSASAPHPMLTRSTSGIRKSNPKYALLTSLQALDSEPTSFREANQLSHWRDTMTLEFKALKDAGTWELVPSSFATHVLPCKWVYRTKRKSDGTVE